MISKNDILKMARHVFKRGHNVGDHRLMHPEREWAIGLVFGLIIFGIGFWYSLGQFAHYHNIENEIPINEIRPVNIDDELMSEVLQELHNKQEIYESLVP